MCARSHVVPINPSRASHHNSIPRLKIAASEKAVEIRLFIQRAIEEDLPTYMWSDSEAALKMINNSTTKFKAFFSNHLSKIHAGRSPTEWRYVDSAQNPADLTSRGIKAEDDEKWHFFHYGPDFLRKPESQWPKTVLQRPHTVNVAAVLTESAEREKKENIWTIVAEKRSAWANKCHLIATIKKTAERWRKKAKARTRSANSTIGSIFPIRLAEIVEAEQDLVKGIQRKHFSEEMDQLKSQGKITADCQATIKGRKINALRRLNPFVHDNDHLCVGSRLLNASISADAAFPLILPPKDENTKALIRHVHENKQHAGPKHTLCHLRQRFWINQGLQAVKSVISRCTSCQKRFKAPATQQMAPLPAMRVCVR